MRPGTALLYIDWVRDFKTPELNKIFQRSKLESYTTAKDSF